MALKVLVLLCLVGADPAEIRIGYFGPSNPKHEQAGAMWQAAVMAIDEANQAGGYHGTPYRLMPSWSQNPWGSGIKGVTALVYEDRVWAIVGAPDSSGAHLVEQVAAKARLAFVNPVSTDRTASLANVPWFFSCAPGDHLLAPLLASAIVKRTGGEGIALVCCTDHASRQFASELTDALHKREVSPALRLDFRSGVSDFSPLVHRLGEQTRRAIVVLAGPVDSAACVSAMRSAGLRVPVFGGPAMGHRLFAATAQEAADGVVFPLLWHPDSTGGQAGKFVERFARRFGTEPDYTAAYTHDAVKLLVAAIDKAGLDRRRIRDAIRELSPWSGVTGSIEWDRSGHNTRAVGLGTIRNGQVDALAATCIAGG